VGRTGCNDRYKLYGGKNVGYGVGRGYLKLIIYHLLLFAGDWQNDALAGLKIAKLLLEN
jgi:hypothetical protein